MISRANSFCWIVFDSSGLLGHVNNDTNGNKGHRSKENKGECGKYQMKRFDIVVGHPKAGEPERY